MQRNTAKVFGILLITLGVVGLISGEKQLLGFLNIDLPLDMTRLLFAVVLLYAAFKAPTVQLARISLITLGAVYLVLAAGGLMSADLGGLLGHNLSWFDKVFHLVAGVAAIAVGAKSAYQGQPAHAK